jgi:hypothetical protein
MTKKEKATFDAAIRELRIVSALRWTERVRPDVPIPKGGVLSKGWLPAYYDGAAKACSSCVSHNSGDDIKTTTQGARELYSTRLLALRARRHELEREFAQQLAEVDVWIEQAGLTEAFTEHN